MLLILNSYSLTLARLVRQFGLAYAVLELPPQHSLILAGNQPDKYTVAPFNSRIFALSFV